MSNTLEHFENTCNRLLGLAYRMLGSRSDAEDIIQDAWIKWSQLDHSSIQNPEAYLTTIVTRLCLDKIKQESHRREAYIGPWLPEPVTDASELGAQAASELADDLSFALLLTLERLSPLERAAFLLHDVFGVPFAEVADILERSEPAVRKLATRARQSVKENKPAKPAAAATHKKLLAAFMLAISEGDVLQLSLLLREDAVYISDGGGVKPAALRTICGADRIIRLVTGLSKKNANDDKTLSAHFTTLNGLPSLLVYIDDVLDQMYTVSVEQDKIAAIYLIRNPDKLKGLNHLVPRNI